MVPTRRLWFLFVLGVPLAALFAVFGYGWAIWAYNFGLLLAAVISFRLAPDTKTLRIRRKFDPVLSVRVPNRVEVLIENEGVEKIGGVFRDEPPLAFTTTEKEFPMDLEPGRAMSLDYHITPPERGSDFFRGSYLKLRCPFGLVDRIVRLGTGQPVRVYPNVLALREFDLLKQRGKLNQMGIRKTAIRGLGSEFESLRDYTEGDDYRKIDWKASARRSKLVVRQYETERNQSVIIVLDIGRKMLSEVNGVSKLDHALDACLMLAHAAQVAGDQVGLLVYADTVRRYIPPKKGRNQVGIIIEAIHNIMAEPVESDQIMAFSYLATRWKRRSLVVAFTDAEDEDQAKDLVTALGPMARRHLTLLTRVSDPRLKESAERGVFELNDLYFKAAALSFTGDRQRAGTRLQSAGVHSIDAEPQELAAALVSYYFMVKERSLL
ncbi:MAG: DUF58 domain-containing protein [Fimbriimonadaceae bacterium]|nr:DUF58 domain-containing protein [Fimbriimonadaceae bacterium]